MNRRLFLTTLPLLSLYVVSGVVGCRSVTKNVYIAPSPLPPKVAEAGEAKDWWLIDVYVDGNRVENCFKYDVDRGEAHCYTMDSTGRPQGFFKDGVFHPVVTCHRGKVKVVYHERFESIPPGY